MNPDQKDLQEDSEDVGPDNILVTAFMELYVNMQAQGAEFPEEIKGLLLQVFAAGSVASLHMLSEGAQDSEGYVVGVSMADIHEAASELLGDIGDDGEDEEEDFDPEESGPVKGSVGYTLVNGMKLYEDDDIQ